MDTCLPYVHDFDITKTQTVMMNSNPQKKIPTNPGKLHLGITVAVLIFCYNVQKVEFDTLQLQQHMKHSNTH